MENTKSEDKLSFAIGQDESGKQIDFSFLNAPHLLITDSDGKQKNALTFLMLMKLFKQNSESELKVVIISPLEGFFDDIAQGVHIEANKVFCEVKEAISVIQRTKDEAMRRYGLFAEKNVEKIEDYNNIADVKLPRIVVLINEFYHYIQSPFKETFKAKLLELVMIARAAGIHVVLGTQKVSRQTITRKIRNNFPTIISFGFQDKAKSRLLLGTDDAANLSNGEFIFKNDYADSAYMKLKCNI